MSSCLTFFLLLYSEHVRHVHCQWIARLEAMLCKGRNELDQCAWASLRALMEDRFNHLICHAYDGFSPSTGWLFPGTCVLCNFLSFCRCPKTALPSLSPPLPTPVYLVVPFQRFVLRPLINLHTLSFFNTDLLQFPSFHHHGPTTASCRRVTKNLL